MAARTPGWADLPRDLLELVLARLPVPDRLRFPAVCAAWRSAAADARLPAVQSPWLMLPLNPTARSPRRGSAGAAEARFLSLADGRTYAVPQPAPAVSGLLCVGSSDGWLVTACADSELRLLNPLTGAQLQLPSVATLPFVDAFRDEDGRVVSYSVKQSFDDGDGSEEEVLIPPESFSPEALRYELYEKAILVSKPRRLASPSTASGPWGGYAVLLICQPLFRLAVAGAGDTKWTLLDTPSRRWVDAVRASAAAATGGCQAVYTMDSVGRVEAWEMEVTPEKTTPAAATPKAVAPPCRCSARACAMSSAACSKYLVELSPGHLLQVHRLRDAAHARYKWEPRPEHVEYTTVEVELFEWKAGGGGQWEALGGGGGGVLAERALFLGKSASVCVAVERCPEVRGNCVYFTDDGPWSEERCREVAPDVGVLDLAGGSYKPPRGAVRDLLWKWPPPVWVFPSCAD